MKNYVFAATLALVLANATSSYALVTGEVTGGALIANGGTQTPAGIMWNGKQYYTQADGGYSTQTPGTAPGAGGAGGTGGTTAQALLDNGATPTAAGYMYNGVLYVSKGNGTYAPQQSNGPVVPPQAQVPTPAANPAGDTDANHHHDFRLSCYNNASLTHCRQLPSPDSL